MKKKQTNKPKARNWLAVHAFRRNRSGGGYHPDKKKQQNKRACRGQVREQ